MKKTILLLIVLVVELPFLVYTLELNNKNLKGLNYIKIQCEFNGLSYFKGIKSTRADEEVEFNLSKLEKMIDDSGFPLTKKLFPTIYKQMETKLKKGGLTVAGIRSKEEKQTPTILPTISINIEVRELSEDSFAALVYLTVSKWMSTWVGSENINQPVIIWWQKQFLARSGEELNSAIEKTANDLIDQLLIQLKNANQEEIEEKNSEKNPQEGEESLKNK